MGAVAGMLYFRQNENLFSSIPMKVPLFKSQTS
jgi:hypothetical protein